MSAGDSSTLDDYRAIGEEGGSEALALVGHLMQRSAEETGRVMDSVLASTEADRDRWKARALWAEARLDRAHRRAETLFFGDDEEVARELGM